MRILVSRGLQLQIENLHLPHRSGKGERAREGGAEGRKGKAEFCAIKTSTLGRIKCMKARRRKGAAVRERVGDNGDLMIQIKAFRVICLCQSMKSSLYSG